MMKSTLTRIPKTTIKLVDMFGDKCMNRQQKFRILEKEIERMLWGYK